MSTIETSNEGVHAARPCDRRPSKTRYLMALLLAIGGAAGALVWTIVAMGALGSYANGFVRIAVPGEVTVAVDHPGTYYVYAEGTRWVHPAVHVTDSTGRAVSITATPAGPGYYHGGNQGSAVGSFHVTRSGSYRVALATDGIAQGGFAVGGSTASWWRPHEWGIRGLLAVTVGTGIVIAFLTAVQRRRLQAT